MKFAKWAKAIINNDGLYWERNNISNIKNDIILILKHYLEIEKSFNEIVEKILNKK